MRTSYAVGLTVQEADNALCVHPKELCPFGLQVAHANSLPFILMPDGNIPNGKIIGALDKFPQLDELADDDLSLQ